MAIDQAPGSTPTAAGRSPRDLLAYRPYWRVAAATQLCYLPMGMVPIAFTLLGRETGHGYRLGGLLVMAMALTQVVSAPLGGRLTDRIGPARAVPLVLAVAGGAYAALAFVPRPAGPLLVVLVLLAGLGDGVAPSGLRTVLGAALPDDLLSLAIALNSTFTEVTLILGPLITALLAGIGPRAPLAALAVVALAAILLLPRRTARRAHAARPTAEAGPRRSLLRSPAMVRWLLSALACGTLFGTVEVGALPLAHGLRGGTGVAALLLAVLSGCSALSGLAYASHGHRLPGGPTRRAAVVLAAMGAVSLVLAAPPTWFAVAIAGMIGLGAAPVMTIQSAVLPSVLPAGRSSEGFGLLFSAQGLGYAIGAALVGLAPFTVVHLAGGAAPILVALVLLTPGGGTAPDGRPRRRGSAGA